MKKFYFMLVAMLLGIGANAADYGIGGQATGGWPNSTWSDANVHQMIQTSTGVYEYQATGECSGGFVIVEYNFSTKTPNWNNKFGTNGNKVEEGTPYSYKAGAGDFSLNGTIIDALFVFDTNAKTLTVTGQAQANKFEVVYMVGDFGDGWDTTITDYPLAAVEGEANTYEGTYTINKTAPAASYFYTVPKCGGQVLQLSGSDVTIDATTSGKAYTLSSGDKSFACLPGTYTFKVVADQEANSAVVTITMDGGNNPDPIEPEDPTTAKFGIVGSMQEPSNWNIDAMFEMTEEADGSFSYHFDSLDKDAAFKIGTIGGTWDDTFGAESNDPSVKKIPVTVGEAMNAWKGSSNDFIISEALTDVTITFTYVEAGPSRITVTAKSEEPVEPIEPEKLAFGVVGSMQEPTIWNIDAMYEMTEADGVYTYTFDELAEGTTFKIGTIGKGWDDTFGAENPDTSAKEAADIPVTVGEAMNAWKTSSNNFLITEALTDVTITFTYVEAGPSLITVTGTVESPDPIEPDDPDPVQPDNFTATFNAIVEAENTPESDFKADGNQGNTFVSIIDKTFTKDNVSLTIGGSNTGAKLYKTSSGIVNYRLYKGDIITIDAPAGYSITQVDVMSQQNKSTSKITNLEADGWTATDMTTVPEGMSCGRSFTPAARTATSQLVIKATHTSSAMRLTQIDVTVTKMTTMVEDVTVDNNDAPVEYYNLNGVRVSEPSNGIYIRRQGNEVTKVIIK